jgi:hypothetical protein
MVLGLTKQHRQASTSDTAAMMFKMIMITRKNFLKAYLF